MPLIDYSKIVDSFEKSDKYQLLKSDVDEFLNFYNDISKSLELRNAIRGIFNYFEIISAGITEGTLDKGFVKRYFENIFTAYYDDWIGS